MKITKTLLLIILISASVTMPTVKASLNMEEMAAFMELMQRVKQLESKVSDLQFNGTQLEASISSLQNKVEKLQNDLSAVQSNTVLGLDGKLTFDSRSNTARFSGVNLNIVNGLGGTRSMNGFGNLIIGYNEISNDRTDYYCSNGVFKTQDECNGANEVWGLNQRSGSHNIVIGTGNEYTQSGALVGGYINRSNAYGGSVLSGHGNTSSGIFSAILSGESVVTISRDSAIVGGRFNKASGDISVVSGGIGNVSIGIHSTISGGQSNIASGDSSAVSGGAGNTASGNVSSVSGGYSRSVTDSGNWAAGSLFEPH